MFDFLYRRGIEYISISFQSWRKFNYIKTLSLMHLGSVADMYHLEKKPWNY